MRLTREPDAGGNQDNIKGHQAVVKIALGEYLGRECGKKKIAEDEKQYHQMGQSMAMSVRTIKQDETGTGDNEDPTNEYYNALLGLSTPDPFQGEQTLG